MSGAGALGPDDELVVLAGEYVLGTLPRDEAAQLAGEAATDPAVADAIAFWEHHLLPLSLQVSPVTPPATLWPRIQASAHGTPLRPVAPVEPVVPVIAPSSRSLGIWRGAAAAGFLLAASFAGIAVLRHAPAPVPVAVLSPLGAGRAAFVMQAMRDGSLSILPISPAAVPAGRDLELWALAAGAKVPQPLGVLPASGETLAAGRVPGGAVQILVSLEPTGGSPTGLPTGPVLYGGALSRPE